MKSAPPLPMAGGKPTNCSDKKSACGRFFLADEKPVVDIAPRLAPLPRPTVTAPQGPSRDIFRYPGEALQPPLSLQPLAQQEQRANVTRFVKVLFIKQRHQLRQRPANLGQRLGLVAGQ